MLRFESEIIVNNKVLASNNVFNIEANVFLLKGINASVYSKNILNKAPVYAKIIHKEICELLGK